MIPIYDINPTARRPVVTYALLGLTFMVMVGLTVVGSGPRAAALAELGVVPRAIWPPGQASAATWTTLLSAPFVHGGWLHFALNALYLHVFGDNVEDVLGRARYLAFFVLSAAIAALCQSAVAPASLAPIVGMSGAVSAILAVYVWHYPHARVAVPLIWVIAEVPAWLYVGAWYAIQLAWGLGWMADPTGSGVAWYAHLGGFACGALVAWATLPDEA